MDVPATATPRARRCAAEVLLGALACAGLCACGHSSPPSTSGGDTLHTAAIERAIAASILAQHHLETRVSCPATVPKQTGHRFSCAATLQAGRYIVSVTETNDRGHVAYRSGRPLVALDIPKVEEAIGRSILSKKHLHATVRCPTEVLQQAGVAFTCAASANGRSAEFAVTEVNGEGHVSYVEQTAAQAKQPVLHTAARAPSGGSA
ncbi:MAG: DUF4333 domain-containing protein [Solirubrobacteraceae bacterium]